MASLGANLPDGVVLQEDNGNIVAVQEGDAEFRGCIGNKWVGFGITALGGVLLCTPVGLATAGIGEVACDAAVGAGITAVSC